MIPIVIVQTPVCDRLGLDGEVVGKRARMLIRQIRVGRASSAPPLAHRDDPAGVQLRSRVSLLGAAYTALCSMARRHDPFADVGEVAAYLMTLIAIVAGVCIALVLSTRSSSDRRNGLSLVNAARRYALARTVVKSVPSTGGAPHADRARCGGRWSTTIVFRRVP
jgi:hypothetical protein